MSSRPLRTARTDRSTVRARVAALVSAVLFAACTGDAGAPDPTTVTIDTLPGGILRLVSTAPQEAGRWSLQLERTIQPAEGDSGELLEPGDVALLEDGRVIVSERGTDAHLKVFAADGRFERRIGRNGAGPGEFRVAFIAARGDTVFVHDPDVGRFSLFSLTDGRFLRSEPSSCCYYGPIGIDGDGAIVLPAMGGGPDSLQSRTRTYLRARGGTPGLDTVLVFHRPADERVVWEVGDGETMSMIMPVPLTPQPELAVDAGGGFVTGWSGEYLLRATRDGRDTTVLFGRSDAPGAVSRAEKTAIAERMIARMQGPGPGVDETALRASFDVSKIPDVRPAFTTIQVDASGRTWVQRSLADTTVVEWDLFDRDRRWLDVLRIPASGWPRDVGAMSLGNERVAVVVEDENGRPAVLVYTLTRRDP